MNLLGWIQQFLLASSSPCLLTSQYSISHRIEREKIKNTEQRRQRAAKEKPSDTILLLHNHCRISSTPRQENRVAVGMQGSARRRSFTRNGVVAGSVWEARMRVDAVNGGIKVFNGEESRDGDGNADEEGMRVYRRLRRNQSDSIAAGRRRRIWTPPPSSASSMNGSIGGSPIPLHKARSELAEDSRELGGVGRVRVLAIGDGSEGVGGDDGEVEMEDEVGRESFDDKEMDLPVEKGKSVEEEEKTINQVHEIPASSPPVVEKKQNCAEIATSPAAEKQEQQQSQRAIDPDPIEPPPCKLFISSRIHVIPSKNTGK